MRVNALVRVFVERWTQVMPKSVEVHIFPALSTTAVWYWPVEDIDTERHVLLPGSVRAVHVTPKSEEVQIFPDVATAL